MTEFGPPAEALDQPLVIEIVFFNFQRILFNLYTVGLAVFFTFKRTLFI